MSTPHCRAHEQFDPDCIDCSDAKDEQDSKGGLTLFQCFPTEGRCAPMEHDWPTDERGQIGDHAVCTKCGMSFIAHIHMEIP